MMPTKTQKKTPLTTTPPPIDAPFSAAFRFLDSQALVNPRSFLLDDAYGGLRLILRSKKKNGAAT